MKESDYQRHLMKKIKTLIPECLILKSTAMYIQGLPDLIVLYKNMWAALEIKTSNRAPTQPNQQHYIDKLGAMSFASFISPDNEGDVLSELQQAFGITRKTRVS